MRLISYRFGLKNNKTVHNTIHKKHYYSYSSKQMLLVHMRHHLCSFKNHIKRAKHGTFLDRDRAQVYLDMKVLSLLISQC